MAGLLTLAEMTVAELVALKADTYDAFRCVDAEWRRTLMGDPRWAALEESRRGLQKQYFAADDELWRRGA